MEFQKLACEEQAQNGNPDAIAQVVVPEFAVEDEDSPQGDAALDSAAARLPLTARICGVLFVANKPLSIEDLAEAVAVQEETVERLIPQIHAMFSDEVHGFSLHRVAGNYQLRTSPGAATCIQRLIPKHARRLSRAAAETLAVIAYKQPVQRAEIETIRGVDVLGTLKTLLDAKLVRIVGRASSAGQPALYGTTQTFLEKFGLNDLSQLPTPREINQLLRETGEEEEGEAEDAVDELEVAAGETNSSESES